MSKISSYYMRVTFFQFFNSQGERGKVPFALITKLYLAHHACQKIYNLLTFNKKYVLLLYIIHVT